MAWAARAGLASPIFSAPIPDALVGLRTGPSAWPELVAQIFGRRDLVLAISVGQIRPQIKPILHVITKSGELVGHLKIGWNDVTSSLVRHEAAILLALADAAAGGDAWGDAGALRVPRVLHHGNWQGREILAVSDLGGSPWYRRRMGLPAAATRHVGHALGVDRGILRTSQIWSSLSTRAERLAGHEDLGAPVTAALTRLRDRLEAWHGSTEFAFGLMHGDWAPWNMASSGSAVAAWDWERSLTQGPIGFDGLFFGFQVDLWIRRLPPEQALARTRQRLPETMAVSGASPEAGPALLRLVLMEVALRQLEGVAAGVPVPDRIYRALIGLLQQAADERWRP